MDNSFKNISIEIKGKTGYLIFNRPDQLNAMNREMMGEIIAGIRQLNSNKNVAVGIITGAGRAFMAGADIKEYADQTILEFEDFQKQGAQLYDAIENGAMPWIAGVNGFALGGGFEIAMACDLIVAKETAKMGLPEVFLSLIPGGGGTQRLTQKIGLNRAKEVLFTGKQYNAETFYQWGIVNRMVVEENYENELTEFANKLSRRSSASLQALKRLANLSVTEMPFNERMKQESKTVVDLFQGTESKQAIQNFISKNEQ